MPETDAETNQIGAAIETASLHAKASLRSMKQVLWATAPVMVGLGLMVLFVCVSGASFDKSFLATCIVILAAPSFVSMVWAGIQWGHLRESVAKLQQLLAQYGERVSQITPPSAIGALLEATVLGGSDGSDVRQSASLLKSLLTSLRAEDQVILTSDQRALLHEMVLPGRMSRWNKYMSGQEMLASLRQDLRPVAIDALALIGQSDSIHILEQFANKTESQELKQSALQSATQIRERLQYGLEQMLRGTEATGAPDMLLHTSSAQKIELDPPQQLLRANQGNPSRREE